MSEPLIVFGSGGHAKVVIEAALARDPERKVHILDDDPGAPVLGRSVSGGREWLSDHLPDAPVALAIGGNAARAALADWLLARGRRLETIIHPTAFVSPSAKIGDGTFLAAGSVVLAEAQLGQGVIVNTGASVDHDCRISEAAHIAPGVRLCGNVAVGRRTLIGVGAAVAPGITIGDDVIVGAGASVVGDLAANGRYVGCPARPIR